MSGCKGLRVAGASLAATILLATSGAIADERPTMAAVLEASSASDWRKPSSDFLLYMDLPGGRVIMELAPDFAPKVIENIRLLTRSGFFSTSVILRSQDNYVAQWGDPNDETDNAQPFGDGAATVAAEFYRASRGLNFVGLDSRDAYADEVGFVSGFPVGRDADDGRSWLAHCYGMLGVARGEAPESGNGSSLYVITGHAPRQLDRNVVLIGRVIQGMELLTTLPRGRGALGFYEDREMQVPLLAFQFAGDLPESERVDIEVLRTGTDTFSSLVESRRYRAGDWFVDPVDKIDLCNVPLPVRLAE